MRWDAIEIIINAPESLLNGLHSTLLADSLRTWYIYRERACQKIYNTNFPDMGNQCLLYNRNVRSRAKHYVYYEAWCEKGIYVYWLSSSLIHHFQVVNFLKN